MSKSLYSVTENPFTGGGIFAALQTLNPPWADEDIAAQLDLIYYGNVSGSKLISPLVERIMTGSKLSAVETATLAGALMATNGNRWAREWATRSAEYNPIENYRMTEEMTDDETVTEYGRRDTRTDNLAHGETRTDNLQHAETRTDNLQHSETRTDDLTRTIDNQEVTTPNTTTTKQLATRGFNSSADVNTDKETTTNTGTNRVDIDGTEKNTGTQGTTGSNTGTQATQGSNTGTQSTQGTDTGTQSNVASGSDTSTRNYQLTRSGNIGVTTSQQMLESERNLWMWSFFYDVVFPDVDTVMTIPIYAETDADGAGGGIVPTGTISIIANGNYDVTNYAAANVNVPQPTGAIAITSNGGYNVTRYVMANVNVPNSYAEADEGKVVSNGALVAQTGPLAVTENGLIDTTNISSVDVNVSAGALKEMKIAGSNNIIYVPAASAVGPMTSNTADYIIPYREGVAVKPDLSTPFEIACRFKVGTAPSGSGNNVFGSANSYYHCPTIAIFNNKIGYFVSTNGNSWAYSGVAITPSGYTFPVNTWVTVKLSWNGSDFTFYADDGTDVYTDTLEGVRPYYNTSYDFEIGGQYKSAYSIAGLGALVDISETYIKQGDTVIW